MATVNKVVFQSTGWVYAPGLIREMRRLNKSQGRKILRAGWKAPFWAIDMALDGKGYEDDKECWVVER